MLVVFISGLLEINSFVIFNKTDEKVIGGQEARPSQFPYQVLMQYVNEQNNETVYNTASAGSIIGPYWILTSARYVAYDHPKSYALFVGAHRSQNDGVEHRIDRFFIHPEFNGIDGYLVHDIALVRTRTPIEFNERVQPIGLSSTQVGADLNCQISGWGYTDEHSVRMS